ncbi:hypothetical protein LTR37_009308 [Vermiconidia calcicola]|uniref:Uncharacterized protein n=1 Tax=Vermiconidia calcicola TaxID=1690605 RepID=A0ACC3N8J1_9PEZI|nr:hypothetical protein LTR37_009308 [Vermiconidia calcicola]
MVSIITIIALAALWFASLVQSDCHFNIGLTRFGDEYCKQQIGEQTYVEQDECKNWDDDQPFAGFRHTWSPPTPAQEDDELFRFDSCRIEIWAERDCSGDYRGSIEGASGYANTFETLGACSGVDPGEYMRSMLVTCDNQEDRGFWECWRIPSR